MFTVIDRQSTVRLQNVCYYLCEFVLAKCYGRRIFLDDVDLEKNNTLE